MIIRSKDKVKVNGKNKPIWVLDTDPLTVTHNTADAEPSVIAFSSDHIKYHLHYSAEYRKDRLRKLVTNGEIETYLDKLDIKVADAIDRQTEKSLETDKEYQTAIAVGDLKKANGLANMVRLCVRDVVFERMIYV